jgi:glycosyltransferase involved in cell wall biosynthesis
MRFHQRFLILARPRLPFPEFLLIPKKSLKSLFFKPKPVATVALNLKPRAGSWGGANQWTSQLVRFLHFNGWKVRFDLNGHADAIVMTHTGLSNATTFGWKEVERFKKTHSRVRCLHRINDNDIRKETSEMDALLADSNRVADHTVFVSQWLRDHHAARWFDAARAHSVITPGADPRFFHPIGNRLPCSGEPLRLVTHHWSDNWKKGFDVYRDIDEMIAGRLAGRFELWVIGRWPADLKWRSARTFGPASGEKLAALLRQCHGYVTASRFEPGAMHVAEGLQCGLPLLYHRDSGGTVEQGLRYGMELSDDLAETLPAFLSALPTLRARLLTAPPSGSRMAAEYFELIQKLSAYV